MNEDKKAKALKNYMKAVGHKKHLFHKANLIIIKNFYSKRKIQDLSGYNAEFMNFCGYLRQIVIIKDISFLLEFLAKFGVVFNYNAQELKEISKLKGRKKTSADIESLFKK